jgi:hypothetical protein
LPDAVVAGRNDAHRVAVRVGHRQARGS